MRHLRVLPPSNAACEFVLDSIDVQTPCEVPWDTMTGDNRVRFCGRCRQNVYNIDALPRAEAVRLIGAREGRLCVRFHRRRDGTVVTADCWSRLRAARRKGVLAFVVMLAIVGAAQVFAMLTGLAGLGRLGARQGGMGHPGVTAGPRTDPPAAVRPRQDEERQDLVMGKPAFFPRPPVHTMGHLRRK